MSTSVQCGSSDRLYRQLDTFINERIKQDGSIGVRRMQLLPVLYHAQSLFGFLPRELQEYVAERLDLHLSEVYGVVSFYSYFTMKPQGKFRISVCTGTACHIKGADRVLERLKQELGIEANDVTRDRRFSIDTLRCVGACGLAPVVLVNDKVYGHVKPEMVPMILKACQEAEETEHESDENAKQAEQGHD